MPSEIPLVPLRGGIPWGLLRFSFSLRFPCLGPANPFHSCFLRFCFSEAIFSYYCWGTVGQAPEASGCHPLLRGCDCSRWELGCLATELRGSACLHLVGSPVWGFECAQPYQSLWDAGETLSGPHVCAANPRNHLPALVSCFSTDSYYNTQRNICSYTMVLAMLSIVTPGSPYFPWLFFFCFSSNPKLLSYTILTFLVIYLFFIWLFVYLSIFYLLFIWVRVLLCIPDGPRTRHRDRLAIDTWWSHDLTSTGTPNQGKTHRYPFENLLINTI